MPKRYKNCTAKCPFSYKEDLAKNHCTRMQKARFRLLLNLVPKSAQGSSFLLVACAILGDINPSSSGSRIIRPLWLLIEQNA